MYQDRITFFWKKLLNSISVHMTHVIKKTHNMTKSGFSSIYGYYKASSFKKLLREKFCISYRCDENVPCARYSEVKEDGALR